MKQEKGTIRGEVIDGKTKQSLFRFNIRFINTDIRVASDLNGYFYIDNVSVGGVA